MALPQFEMGQIIYILSNKTQTILPGIVTEEIYHKRLNGNEVTYKIGIGPAGKQKLLELTKLDGEVYGSLEEIRQVLLEKLTAFVDDLIETTQNRADTWYEVQQGTGGIPAGPGEKVDPSVYLEDLDRPIQQQPQVVYQQPQMNMHGVQNQTVRERMMEPDLLQREVMMQDGTVKSVNINLNPK